MRVFESSHFPVKTLSLIFTIHFVFLLFFWRSSPATSCFFKLVSFFLPLRTLTASTAKSSQSSSGGFCFLYFFVVIPVYFVAPFDQHLCNSIPLFHLIGFFFRKVVKGHHHDSSIITVNNHRSSKDAYQMVCCEAGSVV